MYLSHYGLQKKPFDISPDPSFLWLGEKHREALSYLKYGILENKGFLMITGDVGTGKTALIKRLTKLIDAATFVVTVPDPDMSRLDFFNFLADELKMNRTFNSKGEFLIHFKHFLQSAYSEQRKVLLIIDESQRLNHDLLQEIRLLSNIDLGGKVLLNIFFVGQTEFNDILREDRNRTVRQRISASFHLEPLSLDEVAKYIAHRLHIAGAGNQIFTAEAVQRIYEYTGGYPRLINILCDHALMTGYAGGAKAIVPSMIDESAQELSITFSGGNGRPRRRIEPAEEALPKPAGMAAPEPAAVSPPLMSSEAVVKQMALASAQSRKSFLRPAALAFAVLFILAGIAYFGYGPVRYYLKGGDHSEMTVPPLAGLERQGASADDASPPLGAVAVAGVSADSGTEAATEVPTAFKTGTGAAGTEGVQAESKPGIQNASPEVAAGTTDKADVQPVGAAPAIEIAKPVNQPAAGQPPAGSNSQPSQPPSVLSSPASTEADVVRRAVIYFEHDSNDLPQEAVTVLERLAGSLSGLPGAQISIEGYTDALGNDWYNRKLSQSRADIVRDFFLQRGVHPNRIRSVGLGAENPIASNASYEGRQKNRRVEVLIGSGIN